MTSEAVAAVHSPIPVRATKKAIQSATDKFRKIQDLAPGFVIESLAQKLGGKIEYKEAFGASRSSESIRVYGKSNFTIFVPTDTSPLRDRFTIAHELGHYLMHYPMVVKKYGEGSIMIATRFVDESENDLMRAEWEANWFAAELLMPTTEFRDKWAVLADEESVASFFNVTIPATLVRAKSLGLA